jgi:hypothetical protein
MIWFLLLTIVLTLVLPIVVLLSTWTLEKVEIDYLDSDEEY